MFSYIIKNGTIVDGSGFPKFTGDVGISGETIAAVGSLDPANATRVIDAAGKYIIPGIIDITNHSDTHWALFTNPGLKNLVAQGITTIIGGACGSSLAPLSDIEAIRGIQKWTDISKTNINWKTTEEFFEELSRHEFAVNFGTFVGHGTLRRNIAKDNPKELTAQELESMKLILLRALDEGALGISFNFASSHGRSASTEEILYIARAVAEKNKIVAVHLRNEGRGLLTSVVEVLNIARQTGAHVHISHLKAIGKKAWGDLAKVMDVIKKARANEHLSLSVDVYPYLRTGSLLYTLLPGWILEGGKEKILEVLRDPKKHDTVIESIKNLTLHFDRITVAEARRDTKASGKTIADIAKTTGETPEETMIRLLQINELAVTIFSKLLQSKDVVSIIKESYSMFGSDGIGIEPQAQYLTHPRSYGAAARFLERTAVKNQILSWEDAVKKMTSMPAECLGLGSTRGSIKKGYFADVVVLDPLHIHDTATYAKPYQYSMGVEYVFINGHIALEQGKFTEALAGKILKRG